MKTPLHSVVIRETGKKARVVLRYSLTNAIQIAAQNMALTGETPYVTCNTMHSMEKPVITVLSNVIELALNIDPLSL